MATIDRLAVDEMYYKGNTYMRFDYEIWYKYVCTPDMEYYVLITDQSVQEELEKFYEEHK